MVNKGTGQMINRYWRRCLIGLLAGAISSQALAIASTNGRVGVFLGMLGTLIGIVHTLTFRPSQHSYIDQIMTASGFGIALWAIVSIVTIPLLMGQAPQWTAEGMQTLFPVLIGWIFYGASIGFLVQAFNDLTTRLFGPEYEPPLLQPDVQTRIVILGGGFAGSTVAEHLEQEFGADPTVSFTIVSDTNSLLFTPMLAEVASGTLEPTHISSPLRTRLHRTTVVHGQVVHVDLLSRRVILAPGPDTAQHHTLPFDHLVFALGSVSNYLGQENIAANSLDFKTLADAIHIRNHVINALERADKEPDPIRRRSLVAFIVAGGGFAGVELAGGLNDLIRGLLVYYPNIPVEEVKIILIHSRERILPELSQSLGAYALKRLAARGVTFKLNTRVADASPGKVVLKPQEEIYTDTLIWTAGTKPHPLPGSLFLALDKRGAVIVDKTMAVLNMPGLWALGDCALVPEAETGKSAPATAQFALREAYTLAYNIHASVHGKPLKEFRFKALGLLCALGYHTACAEVMGLRFSGLFAWLLWRGIYLSKLPGLERKLHVLSNWSLELFFPPDSVQTLDVMPPMRSKQAVSK